MMLQALSSRRGDCRDMHILCPVHMHPRQHLPFPRHTRVSIQPKRASRSIPESDPSLCQSSRLIYTLYLPVQPVPQQVVIPLVPGRIMRLLDGPAAYWIFPTNEAGQSDPMSALQAYLSIHCPPNPHHRCPRTPRFSLIKGR